MNEEEISFIQDQIGHRFKNSELLAQAFTRSSYSAENGGEDNEVLEFIGDKVLDIVIVKLLVEKYGHFSRQEHNWDKWGVVEETGTFVSTVNEGQLTEFKKRLVQKSTLANAIDGLGISDFLIVGRGDEENDVRESTSVKEDLFEAIVGAIALDSGWDFESLQDCVSLMLNPEEILETEEINYVSEVQAWSLKHSGEIPFHRFERCSMQTPWYFLEDPGWIYGKTEQDTHFMCKLKLFDVEKRFVGYGRTKALARRDASRLAYEYLQCNNLLLSIRDEIENPTYEEAISQLEILARRGYFPIPTYEFSETHDKDGNPIWSCECHIEEVKHVTIGQSSVKKEAKKQAAFEMLKYVLEVE